MGEEHWYKEAVIYELHVKCFYDSSADGVGDFKGLTQKLDYLKDLGITAIWLLPFYPSPLKDDGYDIADYTDVHPAYGELKDFKEFLRQAHKRGLKVITELVINHTSDQHPWFQRARKAGPHTSARNFYVWSDTWDKYSEARIIFQDFETSNWSWDNEALSYFWHRFYSHQPDLNYDHPEVHKAMFRNLSFWFKLGVDGMRLDAVPYLYEREFTNCENLPETHAFLKKLRSHVDTHFKDRMLLAEANQWPEDAAQYFGEGNECHMVFHFPVMPRLFMAIHLEDSLPITEIMEQTPDIPPNCQWALFLRNHDELTLEMVTDEERDYMFRVYAFDPQARLNLGIRRRLAPLLKNDRRKIELMNALLFSLSGTPVLYYGDELGMGDNIYLGDRDGVRTPMQWSSDKNAGFSRANPQQLYLPPIVDPEYHYETVNVEAQQKNPHSLLWWTKQLIALRKRYKAFSYGKTDFLFLENRKVLVFFRRYQEEHLMVIANLSRFPQYVELDLKEYDGYTVVEMFSGERFPSIGTLPYFLTLGAYGYYWFSLEKQVAEEGQVKKEHPIVEIAFKGALERIFSKSHRELLEMCVKKYLVRRGDIQLHRSEKAKVTLSDHVLLDKKEKIHLVMAEIAPAAGLVHHVPLFVKVLTGEIAQNKLTTAPDQVVAMVKSSDSLLFDIREEKLLPQTLMQILEQQKRIKGEAGEVKGIALDILKEGNLKIFHHLNEDVDPDIEIRLFLTHHTDFKAFVPLLGYIEYAGQHKGALAAVEKTHEYHAKQVFVEAADRFLQNREMEQESEKKESWRPKLSFVSLAASDVDPQLRSLLEEFPEVAHLLGETAGAFHQAMSVDIKDVAFALTSYTIFYQRSLYQTMLRKINIAFSKLKKQEGYKNVASLHEKLLKRIQTLPTYKFQIERLRYHGNFVLENLGYTGKDFLIFNFGSSATLSPAESRYKRSALRDIASMLYSISEAGFEAVEKLQARGLVKDLAVTQEWAFIWSLWISSSFLRAYLHKVEGSAFLPRNMKEVDLLLALFLFELCAEKIANPKTAKLEIPCQLLLHWLPIYEEFKL